MTDNDDDFADDERPTRRCTPASRKALKNYSFTFSVEDLHDRGLDAYAKNALASSPTIEAVSKTDTELLLVIKYPGENKEAALEGAKLVVMATGAKIIRNIK